MAPILKSWNSSKWSARWRSEEGKNICILGDLQGPKIRTGRLQDRKPIQLEAGQRLTITPRDIPGTPA